jgi:bacteriorhodopsin
MPQSLRFHHIGGDGRNTENTETLEQQLASLRSDAHRTAEYIYAGVATLFALCIMIIMFVIILAESKKNREYYFILIIPSIIIILDLIFYKLIDQKLGRFNY